MSERELDKLLNIAPTAKDITPKQVTEMTEKIEKNLELAFPLEEKDETFPGYDDRFEEEFERTRTDVREIIDEVKKTVFRLSMIANDTEKALDFQALSQLTTTLLSANKQILEMYEFKKKYMTPPRGKEKTVNTQQVSGVNINNAVFTGTTADLPAFLEQLKLAQGKAP